MSLKFVKKTVCEFYRIFSIRKNRKNSLYLMPEITNSQCMILLTVELLTAKGKKVKAEQLYVALHGMQTTLKHSGMNHTL